MPFSILKTLIIFKNNLCVVSKDHINVLGEPWALFILWHIKICLISIHILNGLRNIMNVIKVNIKVWTTWFFFEFSGCSGSTEEWTSQEKLGTSQFLFTQHILSNKFILIVTHYIILVPSLRFSMINSPFTFYPTC